MKGFKKVSDQITLAMVEGGLFKSNKTGNPDISKCRIYLFSKYSPMACSARLYKLSALMALTLWYERCTCKEYEKLL